MKSLLPVLILILFASGCTAPARHKITPASTKILEIEIPSAPLPISTPGPELAPVEHGCPSVVHTAIVLASFAQTQPERPETMAEVDIFGRQIRVPPGTKLRYIESTGSGLESTSGEVAGDWNAEAPTAASPESTASGGGLESVVRLTKADGPPGAVLIVLGGLLLAGGIVAGVLGAGWKLGGALALAGGACLAAGWMLGQAPWMLAIAGLGVLGAVGYVVWQGRTGKLDAQALAAVTGAIDTAANGDMPAILENVKSRMGDRRPVLDKAIRRAKRKAGVA